MEELRDKGLVDWIEDENGTEMIFLTEKGKQLGEALFGDSLPDTASVNVTVTVDNDPKITLKTDNDETQQS
jgi:hypothetical protein